MPPPLPPDHARLVLLPPALAPAPVGVVLATADDFISAAFKDAEVNSLRAQVRRLANQDAFNACSDLHVVVLA